MRFALLASLVCFALSGAGSAAQAAGVFVPLNHRSLTLDAAPGHHKDEVVTLNSDTSVLRAHVVLKQLKQDPKWLPSFRWAVKNADHEVAFKIISKQSKLNAALRLYVGGDKKKGIRFDFEPRKDQPFDLEIHWTAAGKVTAAVIAGKAREEHHLDLGLPPKSLELSASTGQVEMAPLELGRFK